MMKFEKGDKVRRITETGFGDADDLVKGAIYTVRSFERGSITLEDAHDDTFTYTADYFALAEAPLQVGDKVMVSIPATVVATPDQFSVLEDAGGNRMYTDIITKNQQGAVELVERPTPTTAEQIRKLEVGTVFTIESFNSWSYVRQENDRIAYLSRGIPERTAPIVDGGWEDSHYKVTALA